MEIFGNAVIWTKKSVLAWCSSKRHQTQMRDFGIDLWTFPHTRETVLFIFVDVCDRVERDRYSLVRPLVMYRSREIFQIDDEVRHMVNENLSTPQLRRQARELGMRTLREDGIRKVLNGMTSAQEIIHVTMADAS